MAKQPKYIRGLVAIRIGPIAGDGDMGTDLDEIGATVIDSAVMSTSEGTQTDFNIEEQDDPIESDTTPGTRTLSWSTHNINPTNMHKLFGGTITTPAAGVIATLGSITAGTGYTNGTYTDVSLTGGGGTGARATITVAGGIVTAVTRTQDGQGYSVSDALSASQEDLGGTGTGFSIPVATVTTTTSMWEAPASAPDIELSIEVKDRKGNRFEFPRAKFNAKMTLNFQKSKLGQVDITTTILTPTKAGVASIKMINYAD